MGIRSSSLAVLEEGNVKQNTPLTCMRLQLLSSTWTSSTFSCTCFSSWASVIENLCVSGPRFLLDRIMALLVFCFKDVSGLFGIHVRAELDHFFKPFCDRV